MIFRSARSHTGDEELARFIGRWAGAALCVAAVHGGGAWAVLNWPNAKVAAGEPPAAVMIELAPMPAAPEVPQQNVAVGPEMVMSDASNPSESKEEPVEEKEPPPEPVKETVAETEETPKLEEVPNAEAVLDAPAEKPPEPEKTVEKEPEPPKPKEPEQSKPQEQRKKAAQATAAPKPIDAARAKTNVAPISGVSSSMSMATWRGMVMAHLHRHKRYSGAGANGTATIAFTIDRSGRVVSARLIRGSGNGMLDQEAVALARRASPVPAPPANVGGRTVLLTLPLRLR